MTAILRISDGTNTVDLLRNGWSVQEWTPKTAQPKGGGTYANSPLADGQRLKTFRYDNVVETITLQLQATNQDRAIARMRELRAMLVRAKDHWVRGINLPPVYIMVRAPHETNTRYATIVQGNVEEGIKPFGQQFNPRFNLTQRVTITDIPLILERLEWRSLPPGETEAIPIWAGDSNWSVYSPGNFDSSLLPDFLYGEVYVANNRRNSNITHIFRYDDDDGGAPSWTDISPPAALPIALFPAVPAVDDILYIGASNVTDPEAREFDNLVFDLIGGDGYDLTWEYYGHDGAGGHKWRQFLGAAPDWNYIKDQTSELKRDRVCSVHFDMSNYAMWPVAVNGVTAYWIRAVITKADAWATPPIQQNRDVYSISWNWFEIAESDAAGEHSLLLDCYLRNASDRGVTTATNWTALNHIVNWGVLGTRSMERGEAFESHIPISDEQLPPGVTVTSPINISFTAPTATTWYYGHQAMYFSTATNNDWLPVININFDSTVSLDYVGEYRLFVLAKAGQTETKIKATLYASAGGYMGETQPSKELLTGLPHPEIVDLGKITLSMDMDNPSLAAQEINIVLQVFHSTLAIATLYAIVLIPTDECIISVTDDTRTLLSRYWYDTGMLITATNEKPTMKTAIVSDDAVREIYAFWRTNHSKPLQLRANQAQRIHTLFGQCAVSTGTHVGVNNATILYANSVSPYIEAGDAIYNITDGSYTRVTDFNFRTAVSADIFGNLRDGTDNDWDNGDVYLVIHKPLMAQMGSCQLVWLEGVRRYLDGRGNS